MDTSTFLAGAFKQRIKEWVSLRSEEELAYALAGAAFTTCVVYGAIANQLGKESSPGALLLPLLLMVYGFTQFISGAWATFRSSSLYSLATSAILIIGGALLLAISGIAANIVLEAPSFAFQNTRAFVSMMLLPALILIVAAIVGLFSPLLVFIRHFLEMFPETLKGLLLRTNRPSARTNELVAALRLMSVIVFSSSMLAAVPMLGPYLEAAAKAARWYAYSFDAEPYSHCQLAEGERIAYLDGDLVIRAKTVDGDFRFQPGRCNPAVQLQ